MRASKNALLLRGVFTIAMVGGYEACYLNNYPSIHSIRPRRGKAGARGDALDVLGIKQLLLVPVCL